MRCLNIGNLRYMDKKEKIQIGLWFATSVSLTILLLVLYLIMK